ncbi:MAG: NAD-dependent epimerase/dehydratase family protein [Calditrichaeota bacterium]|nr:MAG: NAD-dependent epimerase/dehydratase family protein [Calditrichota bacterium]
MKVFVTGATGYIGFAVARAFRQAGHQVKGLIRNPEKAALLERWEIEPVVGNLDQPESYREAAEACSVLVHTAFEASGRAVDLDHQTVDTLIGCGERGAQPKLLIYTSGVWVYGNTRHQTVDESTPLSPAELVRWRPAVEEKVLSAEQVRGLVIRPGCVYGGRGGLTGLWFQGAESGNLTAIGDGQNHWAMVHVEDLAQAYRAAGEVGYYGEVLNVCDASRLTVREMVEAVARATGYRGSITFKPVEEAAGEMGPFAECLALDQHVDAFKARTILNWQPNHRNFVEEVALYYRSWKQHQAG